MIRSRSTGGTLAKSDAKKARDEALRAVRRGLVLDAAFAIFAEQGLAGATMRSIAARAGCTTGAVYPLFESKEAIYAELLLRSLDSLGEATVRAVADVEPGWPTVEAMLRQIGGYYRDRPEELSLAFYLYAPGIGRRGLSRELDRTLNERLMRNFEVLERGFGELGVDDPRTEAVAAFAGLVGALVLLHTGRLDTLGSTYEEVVERHLAGLMARYRR